MEATTLVAASGGFLATGGLTDAANQLASGSILHRFVVAPFNSADAWLIFNIGPGGNTTAHLCLFYPSSGCIPGATQAVDIAGQFLNQATSVPPGVSSLAEFHRPYPNPFNPSTRLSFTLPAPALVRLRILDLQGRVVRELTPGQRFAAGTHEVAWNGQDGSGQHVGTGAYFGQLVLEGSTVVDSRRLLLLKQQGHSSGVSPQRVDSGSTRRSVRMVRKSPS